MASRGRGAGTRAQAARLAEVITPVTRAAGYDLEKVTVSRLGRRHLVRVVIDSDAGVDLDAIAEVSRAVSAALDAAEQGGDVVIAGEYVLEVSSPGVERPLTQPRHWRRNIGRLVTVPVTRDGVTQRWTGRVVAADDDGVVLDVEGSATQIAYASLGAGRVQVELGRVDDADGGGQA